MIAAIRAALAPLNTHTTSAAGASIAVAGLSALITNLSSKDFLAELYVAASLHRDPAHAVLTLSAALIGIAGGLTLAYLGRPATVSSSSAQPTAAPEADVHSTTSPAVQPGETDHPDMSWFTNLIHSFVAPEERALGPQILAEYNANKGAIVAALQAKGVSVAAVLKADADTQIPAIFAKIPYGAILEPFLAPVATSAVNGLIDKAVAAAPSETAAIEAYADALVARIVAALEAA